MVPPKNLPPIGGGKPAQFPKPPLGKDLVGPYRPPVPGIEALFEPDVVRVVKKRTETGYRAPVVGDPHPDSATYPNHKLLVPPIPMEDGETVELLYARLRTATNKITNRVKQLATQIRNLITTGSSTAVPTALSTVEVTDLGLGESVEEVTTDPSLFPASEFEVQIPDLIPQKFRGILPTRTTSQNEIGTAIMPVLGTGELRRDAKQLDVFVERTEVQARDLTALPATLTDQETTEQYGGGILSVVERLDNNPQDPDQGLLVVESSVTNLGAGLELKETKTLEDTEWPELVGDETDPTYGIIIHTAKKVIAAGTPYPGETLSIVSPYVDINPIDKWRSIQIVSKIDPDSLPADLVSYGTHEVDLPATLLGVTANWDKTGGTSQLAEVSPRSQAATAKVSVSSGVLGSIEILFRHNYRGPALATITRHFSFGPPPLLSIPSITKIIPVTGTASLTAKHVSFSQSRGTSFDAGGTNSEDTNDGQLRTESKTFGPFLSGGVVNNTSTFSDGTIEASASAGPDFNGHTFNAVLVLPGSSGTLKIKIPVSTPTDISSGDKFIVLVQPENWRFGIFVTHIVEVTIP